MLFSKYSSKDEPKIIPNSDLEKVNKSNAGHDINNKYTNFPPMMKDGRSLFTTNQTPIQPQIHIPISQQRQTYNFSSRPANWEYRRFLTNYSNIIRKKNYMDVVE